jgi:hypothetical protein
VSTSVSTIMYASQPVGTSLYRNTSDDDDEIKQQQQQQKSSNESSPNRSPMMLDIERERLNEILSYNLDDNLYYMNTNTLNLNQNKQQIEDYQETIRKQKKIGNKKLSTMKSCLNNNNNYNKSYQYYPQRQQQRIEKLNKSLLY